jgi:hypothetical protein
LARAETDQESDGGDHTSAPTVEKAIIRICRTLNCIKKSQSKILEQMNTQTLKTSALQEDVNASLQNQRDLAEKIDVLGEKGFTSREPEGVNSSARHRKAKKPDESLPDRSGRLGVCTPVDYATYNLSLLCTFDD